MKTNRPSSQMHSGLRLLPLLLLVPALNGCMFLQPPPTDDIPPKVKEPTDWVFDPNDGMTKGTELNKANDNVLPDAFVVPANGIMSGDMVAIQTVDGGKYGPTADPVHLAGIIAPHEGQPGYEQSRLALSNWIVGKKVDVQLDSTYPTDVDGKRMVSIIFTGAKGGKQADQKMVLNRMMVRAGYAIVDLYSPTSFDTKVWLMDEAFARRTKAGLWQTPDAFTIVQQRVPAAGSNKLKVVEGSSPLGAGTATGGSVKIGEAAAKSGSALPAPAAQPSGQPGAAGAAKPAATGSAT